MATTFLKEPGTRKWIMQVIVVLLFFALMAWVAWLFYDYEIKQMKQKTGSQPTIKTFFPL